MNPLEYIVSSQNYLEDHVDKSKKPFHPLLGRIAWRQKKSRDSRIIIQGPAGIGKSWLGLVLGEELDPLFKDDPVRAVDEQVFWKAEDFMHGVRTLKDGSYIQYDEPAQSWHHREFMTAASIILSKTVLSFRYKHFKTSFLLPSIDLIDKDARVLNNFMINCLDQGKSEVYTITPRKFGGGEPWYNKIIDSMTTRIPSVKLQHAYEKKKFETEDNLYAEYDKILTTAAQAKPKLSNDELLAKIQANPSAYYKKGKLYPPKIMIKEGVARHTADGIVSILNEDDD